MDVFAFLAVHLDLRGRFLLAFLCTSHMKNPSIFISDEEASSAIVAIAKVCKEKDIAFWTLGTLLKAGGNVNHVTVDGATALSFVCHERAARALIAAKADINKVDYKGYTALTKSAFEGREQAARVLIAAGADVKYAKSGGFTSLMFASGAGHEQIVHELIGAGAPVNQRRQSDGSTALMLAVDEGKEKVVISLIEAGADPNLSSRNLTPLISAAKKGDEKIVHVLLENGATYTAFEYAVVYVTTVLATVTGMLRE